MPFVRIGEKKIHFKEEARHPGLLPVILIHGAGGSSNIWLRQIKALEESFHVLAVDLPGHGYSGGNGEKTVGDYARCVSSLLDAFDFQEVSLVGHSMGGAVAMTLAVSEPGRVRRLVLAGSGARLRVPREVFEALARDFQEAIRVICRYAYSPHFPTYLLSLGEAEMGRSCPDVLLRDLAACDKFDIRPELSKIKAQSMMLCGREDRFTPPELSCYLRDNLPNSRLEIIEGAGHMAMIEETGAFNQALVPFLGQPISS